METLSVGILFCWNQHILFRLCVVVDDALKKICLLHVKYSCTVLKRFKKGERGSNMQLVGDKNACSEV